MIRINTQTSVQSIEYKIELIDKLKKEEKDDWEFPIDSSLKIVELLNYFHKVHFWLSELLSLALDFDDVYESNFDAVNNSDIKIIKNILDRILVALQKLDLEEKRKESLFDLVFIINKCECKYNTDGNIFVQKLKSFMDDICSDIESDFHKIMDFIVEEDKAIYKIMYHCNDIASLSKLCNKLSDNPDSLILDRTKLKEILRKISGNGIFNQLIAISEKLFVLKLQICNL